MCALIPRRSQNEAGSGLEFPASVVRDYVLNDLSTNCWWVALMTYGEGWHNNHHAFPTSARHGLRPWELDLSYGFIRMLKALQLAWEVRTPSPERLRSAFQEPRSNRLRCGKAAINCRLSSAYSCPRPDSAGPPRAFSGFSHGVSRGPA